MIHVMIMISINKRDRRTVETHNKTRTFEWSRLEDSKDKLAPSYLKRVHRTHRNKNEKEAYQSRDPCWSRACSSHFAREDRGNHLHSSGNDDCTRDPRMPPVGKELDDLPGVITQAIVLEGAIWEHCVCRYENRQ